MANTPCEQCSYYVYNKFLECYECTVNMDEDDLYRYLSSSDYNCPYYRPEDDYFLARKQ